MKTKDIAQRYGLELASFDEWLKKSGYPCTAKFTGGLTVDDNTDCDSLVGYYQQHFAAQQQRIAEEQQRIAEEQREQQRLVEEKEHFLASMLITSGFSFDGYTITKYSGYISGDDAISVERPSHGFWGGVQGDTGQGLMDALKHIRRNALAELKEAAYALGCNAVIGVDFDYLTLDPETATNNGGTLYLPFLFGVTANGNAVVIEKSQA